MKNNDKNNYSKNSKKKYDSFSYNKFEKEYYMDEINKYLSGQNDYEKYTNNKSSVKNSSKKTNTYKLYGNKSYINTTKKRIKKKSLFKRFLRNLFAIKKSKEITYEDALAKEALKSKKTLIKTKKKKKSKFKSFIMRIAIGIIIPFAILLYVDQVYLSTSNNNAYKNEVVNATIKDIPKDAKSIGFSADNTSYMYIKDSTLFLKYIKDQSMRKTIVDADPIVDALFMEDRNIVLYFTIEKNVKYTQQINQNNSQDKYDDENSSSSENDKESNTTNSNSQTQAPQTVNKVTDVLKVKTFNMDSGESTLQQSIKINNFKDVEQVEYSSKTNVIYLKLSSKTTLSEMNYIYRINIMKTVTLFSSAPKLGNMGILSTEDAVYYEYNNAIFYNWNEISELNNLKPKLIDCAGDMAYITTLSKPKTIYKYKGLKKSDEISLLDSEYRSAYQNRGKLYLIYDKYMIDLTGDLNKKINFDNGSKFVSVSNGVLYTQDSDNTIKSKKIS